jgi:hypothetical protein
MNYFLSSSLLSNAYRFLLAKGCGKIKKEEKKKNTLSYIPIYPKTDIGFAGYTCLYMSIPGTIRDPTIEHQLQKMKLPLWSPMCLFFFFFFF